YHEWADISVHPDLTSACSRPGNIYAVSTRGTRLYTDARLQAGDTLVFGPETRGLPQDYLDTLDQNRILRIPMLANSRSLNLSNAVAVLVYEGLRQNSFSAACGDLG
ncbi:MAG: tRNA (uridine(34)/cytosine(34)/5-carboxymethylaminomethyluridine(34)-2'-O)-methyltransferase TrmL, partial [Thiotrichales bacterium]